MNSLQRSLAANTLFSLTTGILLLLFAMPISDLFGLSDPLPFWIIGGGLLLFAFSVYRQVKLQKPMGVLSIIVQDLMWVVGSIVLLILNPFNISPTGNLAIGLVALVVFGLAMAQSQALAQTDAVPGEKVKRFHFEREVNASSMETWSVISDVGNYHSVAPNIDGVEIMSGNGVGMERSCSSGKKSWTEVCTLWKEGEEFAFKVNTEAPDYPFPFEYLTGSWVVEPMDAGKSRILLNFDFRYRRKIQNVLVHPLVKGKFRKTGEELLDNWQAIIEKGAL